MVKEKAGEEIVVERKQVRDIGELPGVGEATAEKLREAGITTIERLAVCSAGELALLTGIGGGTANKIINAARDALEIGYETADKVLERRQALGHITTGSKALDELLGGGIETGAITEVFGRFATSKTQLAFQLCVNAQLPREQGGAGGEALFIDCESTFRPERIIQIAQAKGLPPEDALKKIHVVRAYNSDHQMLLLEKAEELFKKHPIKLIVIDSLTAHFRADYVGRGMLAERQQKLNRHLHTLQKLCEAYGCAAFVTNQVLDKPDILFGDPTAPVGGNILAHASAYRVYLRKSKEDKRIARLVDSPHLPEGECLFRVTSEGICDAEENARGRTRLTKTA